MERLLVIGGLFALAGLCEIGGGYLVWGWMREHKPLMWALLGAAVLAAYGVVAALQPISQFGRVYAAYGGIFIALSPAWGIIVDGFTANFSVVDPYRMMRTDGRTETSTRPIVHAWLARVIINATRCQTG